MDNQINMPDPISNRTDTFSGILDSRPIIKNINIEPLNLGFMVRVGCQTIAVRSKQELIRALTDYINDPSGVEKAYYNGELGARNG